jgi:hypothetical protein
MVVRRFLLKGLYHIESLSLKIALITDVRISLQLYNELEYYEFLLMFMYCGAIGVTVSSQLIIDCGRENTCLDNMCISDIY